MGRAVVTKGHRRVGRIIRKLEASVELSPKEAKAKVAENEYKQKIRSNTPSSSEDSVVQNIVELAKKKQSVQP
jgi:hypothetical protein